MKKFLAAVAALTLLAAPSVAAQDGEQPPAGAALIVVYQYDGAGWLEAGVVAVPPVGCVAS